jgi:hypothetical protein
MKAGRGRTQKGREAHRAVLTRGVCVRVRPAVKQAEGAKPAPASLTAESVASVIVEEGSGAARTVKRQDFRRDVIAIHAQFICNGGPESSGGEDGHWR